MIKLDHTRSSVIEILASEITGEYSWLDFKLEYQSNPEDLVHDILCISNARHDGERFIIYGVEDSTWELKGLSEDLVSHNIYNIINSQVWNQKPIVAVDHVTVNEMRFGYIVVANTPTKPHYLRKPYKGIPAASIYTRQGDTNTPFRSKDAQSIEDGELEQMFRERFGLDKPLLEKLEALLKQTKKWSEFRDGETAGYFHADFPEFQIRFRERCSTEDDDEFYEDWVEVSYKKSHLIQRESQFSRVKRTADMFSPGREFDVYVHSTPIYQDGSLIRIYKVECPYPKLLPVEDRYPIRTNKSDNRNARINYYVGAISCYKENAWVHHAISEPEGAEIFRVYNIVLRDHIYISRNDNTKEPMLVLDID